MGSPQAPSTPPREGRTWSRCSGWTGPTATTDPTTTWSRPDPLSAEDPDRCRRSGTRSAPSLTKHRSLLRRQEARRHRVAAQPPAPGISTSRQLAPEVSWSLSCSSGRSSSCSSGRSSSWWQSSKSSGHSMSWHGRPVRTAGREQNDERRRHCQCCEPLRPAPAPARETYGSSREPLEHQAEPFGYRPGPAPVSSLGR